MIVEDYWKSVVGYVSVSTNGNKVIDSRGDCGVGLLLGGLASTLLAGVTGFA